MESNFFVSQELNEWHQQPGMDAARSSRKHLPANTTSALVLVADDDPPVAAVLCAHLEGHGLRTRIARDGPEALQLFRRFRPDLVLLDTDLPGLDGLDVLRAIREHHSTPVIMLSALAGDVHKLVALRLGADDFLVKPFNPFELVARVQAVFRRTHAQPTPTAAIRVGALDIDLQAHCVVAHDRTGRAQPLPLTLTEFRLLSLLASQPGRCFSRAQLIERCLPESDALDRVIDSHLSKLRQKLQNAGQTGLIKTIRGVGYRLTPDD